MTKIQIKKTKLFNLFYVVFLILAIIFLVIMPNLAMTSFFKGLQIWATKVLPALLPFFVLTKLLSYTNFLSTFGRFLNPITSKIYGVGGNAGYVYLLSVISGYPVGAKLTSDLYTSKQISKGQAITISSFASTSGPLFILGTVAIGMFGSIKIGVIIMISHILGALINGLFYKCKDTQNVGCLSQPNIPNPLGESMSSSISSILSVGGFIAIFYMLLQLLIALNIFSPIASLLELVKVPSNLTTAILSGIIEVTTGCLMLSSIPLSNAVLATIATFLISFGGLSIHAQAFTFLKSFQMPYKLFFLQKLTQAIFSTLICLCLIFLL